jgi:hypothetical protein
MTLIIVTPTATRAAPTTGASTTPRTATAASGSPATKASAALGLRTRLINIQCAPAEFLAIEGRDGFLSFGGVRHLDEGKSARTARVSVSDNADLIQFSVWLKQRPQLGFGGAMGDVANKKLLHIRSFS